MPTPSNISFLHYVGPKDPFFPPLSRNRVCIASQHTQRERSLSSVTVLFSAFDPWRREPLAYLSKHKFFDIFYLPTRTTGNRIDTRETTRVERVKRANIFFVLFRFFFFGFDIARPCAYLRTNQSDISGKKEVGNFHRETFCSESRQQKKSIDTSCVVNGQRTDMSLSLGYARKNDTNTSGKNSDTRQLGRNAHKVHSILFTL